MTKTTNAPLWRSSPVDRVRALARLAGQLVIVRTNDLRQTTDELDRVFRAEVVGVAASSIGSVSAVFVIRDLERGNLRALSPATIRSVENPTGDEVARFERLLR